MFKTRTGVKQGGPLSPKLYNINIAGLISIMNELKAGAFISKLKINIIANADDLLLISSTKPGLIDLIEQMQVYMIKWKIVINWDKTNYITIGHTKLKISPISINNTEIKRVKEVKYLGLIINEKFESDSLILTKSKALRRRTYLLYNTGLLNTALDIASKSFTYDTYYRPSLMYGLDLLDLT